MREVPRRRKQEAGFLDKAIGAVFPGWALKRAAARNRLMAMQQMSARIRRTAGKKAGTMQNWIPERLTTPREEALEREDIAYRTLDLVANDPHAGGLLETYVTSVVGSGLKPKSKVSAAKLGITEEEAEAFQDSAEGIFNIWVHMADVARRMNFWDIQMLLQNQMLKFGEFLVLPRMLDIPRRPISLALQVVNPLRLRTPFDKYSQDNMRDGVELGENGEPVAYWIKKGDITGRKNLSDNSSSFVRLPAFKGHRPQVLHGFIQEDADQVRGVSPFSRAMKTFRDLNDYLDAELVANLVTAAYALWIETPEPEGASMDRASYTEGSGSEATRYEEIMPGGIYYGLPGEKASQLKPERPGRTFQPFVGRVMRMAAAGMGMPYEVLAKDFSETTYASGRMAMLEAWRVFRHRQGWLGDHGCQPVWNMVQEEAWLKGFTPAKDYYEAMDEWNRVAWIGPAKGYIEPVKEVTADLKAINGLLRSRSEVIAERGGDFEATVEALAKEKKKLKALDLLEEDAA